MTGNWSGRVDPEIPEPNVEGDAAGARGARPVLVPLDGSLLAETALPWAALLARRWRAPLVLVRVVEAHHYAAVSLAESGLGTVVLDCEQETAAAYLHQKASALRAAAPDLEVCTETPLGDPALCLMELEKRRGARLAVLTTHGRTGLTRWARGSVAETIVRFGNAPVLLVRPWDRPEPAARLQADERRGLRVLVALDGSPLAEGVLATATDLAVGEEGELILTGIVKTEDERAIGPYYVPHVKEHRKEMRRYLSGLCKDAVAAGVSAHVAVGTERDVAGAIVDLASVEAADVIALSTHGRGTLGRLLYGSVADRVAHAARVPVLLYRPQPAAAQRALLPADRAAAPPAAGAQVEPSEADPVAV